MIGNIKKFFEAEKKEDIAEEGTKHDVRVATCAIMLEMAHIDGEFSAEEQEHISENLRSRFELDKDVMEELVTAANVEVEQSIDMWGFTNKINQNYSKDEKLEIMEMIWRLVYIDGVVDKHEQYLMRKLSSLLRLTHKDMIDTKLKAREGE
ncbi:hypothetical protein MNBD_NITROSPINAE02-22 [hydrothermal vent metagenome]|uniref:Co-chaperone DjlA N-terminal domain-containing protein n=1 Tax=hydrothermal vent metagenome TaxID=652676 RepID=A0A3B1CIN7_9ZZZZ